MNIALIIAGGRGVRMGGETPKQFLPVRGKPVIAYTMQAFERHPDIDLIACVCVSGWEDELTRIAAGWGITKLRHIIPGGDCGQASIRNGVFELERLYGREPLVLVHDAIRPMVSQEIITGCITCAEAHGSAVVCVPCQEAMLETKDGLSSGSAYPRANLRRTQTPQGFRLGALADLQREALEKGVTNSIACCTLMAELGYTVWFSDGSEKNIKLTTPDDMVIFEALLELQKHGSADR